MSTRIEATIEDLYRLPHDLKAEIIDGEIVILDRNGQMPARAVGAIYASLRGIEKSVAGRLIPGSAAFQVDLSHRKSFSPDASFFTGETTGMKFLEGAPVFAVEIRNEQDYGPAAETAIVRKRADYFAAGTLVVWDVDLLSDDVIRVYRATDPNHPIVYRRGESAEAEPAVRRLDDAG